MSSILKRRVGRTKGILQIEINTSLEQALHLDAQPPAVEQTIRPGVLPCLQRHHWCEPGLVHRDPQSRLRQLHSLYHPPAFLCFSGALAWPSTSFPSPDYVSGASHGSFEQSLLWDVSF
jgi:hypothetical protein